MCPPTLDDSLGRVGNGWANVPPAVTRHGSDIVYRLALPLGRLVYVEKLRGTDLDHGGISA